MNYYTVTKIYPWLYSIRDPLDVFSYLITGEKSAILFDTCFGVAPLKEAITSVCTLPVEVVLGHGHVDHVGGAYEFDEAWLHSADNDLCLRHSSKTARRNVLERIANISPKGFDDEAFIHAGVCKLRDLEHNKFFDLGGLSVEVVPMEGHTAGSVGLFIREHKVLLNSDSANNHIWMFLDESLPMQVYISMLNRVKQLDFEVFFTGHSDIPRLKSDFDKYIAVAENASPEKSKPYERMPELGGMIYEEGKTAIVFRPANA